VSHRHPSRRDRRFHSSSLRRVKYTAHAPPQVRMGSVEIIERVDVGPNAGGSCALSTAIEQVADDAASHQSRPPKCRTGANGSSLVISRLPMSSRSLNTRRANEGVLQQRCSRFAPSLSGIGDSQYVIVSSAKSDFRLCQVSRRGVSLARGDPLRTRKELARVLTASSCNFDGNFGGSRPHQHGERADRNPYLGPVALRAPVRSAQ